MQPQGPQRVSLPGVKHLVAVASGKGGVGKSTVAANLALALQLGGQRVGLMDADIFGPSVPMMMGLGVMDPQKTAFPVEKYGLKLMSMGFLPDASRGVLGGVASTARTDRRGSYALWRAASSVTTSLATSWAPSSAFNGVGASTTIVKTGPYSLSKPYDRRTVETLSLPANPACASCRRFAEPR